MAILVLGKSTHSLIPNETIPLKKCGENWGNCLSGIELSSITTAQSQLQHIYVYEYILH